MQAPTAHDRYSSNESELRLELSAALVLGLTQGLRCPGGHSP